MRVKDGYIKKHIMSKVGEALMGNSTPTQLPNGPYNSIVTYTPKETHLIKQHYLNDVEGGLIKAERVSYSDFNNMTRTTSNLSVVNLPTDCYEVVESQGHYTYHSNFGTLLTKVFQRYMFKIGEHTQKELIHEPAYREKVKVEFDVSKDETRLIDVRIYTDDNPNNRCDALERRAKRIYNLMEDTGPLWMATLSYWMKTIREDEPVLLAHVRGQQSLKDYQGEEV